MITSLILFTVLLSSSSFEQKINVTLSLSEDQLENMMILPELLNKTVQLQSTTLSLYKESSNNSKKLSKSLNKIVKRLTQSEKTFKMVSQNLNKTSESLGKIVGNQQTNNPPEEKPEESTIKSEAPTIQVVKH